MPGMQTQTNIDENSLTVRQTEKKHEYSELMTC